MFNPFPLERVNTNSYNKYTNKIIIINKYSVSIQANSIARCIPKENYENPFHYSHYEICIMQDLDVVIPMAFKEHFDMDGYGLEVSKDIVIKILKYIGSPICMMMDP